MGKLTALAVKNAKPGRHGDGGGLYLVVKLSGAKSWVLRVQLSGKRRDIGLGSLSACTLLEAREKAAELRKHALNGRDPIAERDRDRRPIPTFREAAIACHAALKAGWVTKNATAFLTSLETHAFPVCGNLRVDGIEVSHIHQVLRPIWTIKPELARKIRMRIGQVLNYAKSQGWRAADAPGRSVTIGLAKQASGTSFQAMPYVNVPAFAADIAAKASTGGRRALLFLILTAARSGEVRQARWNQIDFERAEWNRPSEIMKSRQPHTVTLSQPALSLLRSLLAEGSPQPDDLLFPSTRNTPLSDMTLTKVLRDAGLACTAHGFRSSFRDWAAEQMHQLPDAVAEAALAHEVPEKVVRAYKRTTFLGLRRELLESWGAYVLPLPPTADQSAKASNAQA